MNRKMAGVECLVSKLWSIIGIVYSYKWGVPMHVLIYLTTTVNSGDGYEHFLFYTADAMPTAWSQRRDSSCFVRIGVLIAPHCN